MLDSESSLECIEIKRELIDISGARALREHDSIRSAGHHRGKIAERQTSVECIHPNVDFLLRFAGIQQAAGNGACRNLLVRRHGIFEIED